MARNKRKRKDYRHTFGPSLAYTGLIRIISDDELYTWFKFLKDYDEQEKLALLGYARRYGETPSLNFQIANEWSTRA